MIRHVPAALLLMLLLGSAGAVPGKGNGNGPSTGAGSCDCQRIPLKPGPPVCGEDGLDYVNACLAACQGVTVLKPGRCPGNSGKPEWVALKNADTDGYATLAEVLEFQSEGFKMTGRYKPKTAPRNQPVESLGTFDNARADAGKPLPTDAESFELRFTPSGNTFVRKVPNNPRDTGKQSTSMPPRNGKDSGPGRKLKIFPTLIGPDDRSETASHGWPYSAVGVVGSHCSGALIGPNSVLTAGHCVYDIISRTYLDDLDFLVRYLSPPFHSTAGLFPSAPCRLSRSKWGGLPSILHV
mmetsp:Transcript_32314/g.91615  ORF Transcript_32314/g.91615 Transcript_32314/m.91615 type:complete len:296 (-) Transcript_32314:789-1676(-)